MQNQNNGNGNLFMAVVLSALVLIGYHYLFEKPRFEAQQKIIAAQQPAAPGTPKPAPESVLLNRADIIAAGFKSAERIAVASPRLHGSLNLRGARIDDLTMADYRTTLDPTSPEVVLLAPGNTAAPDRGYFAEFGWLGDNAKTPEATTLWHTADKQLTPEHPVTLTTDVGGLHYTRTIALDADYMFTVTDRVHNAGNSAVSLAPYGIVVYHMHEPQLKTSRAYEGALGVFDGTLHDHKYKALHDDGAQENTSATGGWIGLTDQYWLAALVPAQDVGFTGRMQEVSSDPANTRYQVDARYAAQTVAPGADGTATTRFFAGAKEVKLLDKYQDALGIPRFDRAVDWGWFYFLTKPFFYALDTIAATFNNTGHGFAWAIILFTIVLKLIFFPLQNKSYKAMNRMKALTPRLNAIRERHKDDKQQQQLAMFELYKTEKVNPMAGCWPVLLQIPVFFALYKVLYTTIEMRHAAGFGWIADLSAVDPSNIFTLFGLLPYTPPSFLHLGALPLLMGVTMFLQQKMSPAAPDPAQAAMFKWMPVIFTVMLAGFPAGLVMYWTWSNLLSITQQYVLLKRHA